MADGRRGETVWLAGMDLLSDEASGMKLETGRKDLLGPVPKTQNSLPFRGLRKPARFEIARRTGPQNEIHSRPFSLSGRCGLKPVLFEAGLGR